MEDQEPDKNQTNPGPEPQRTEPVRSRWNPKPEQILILETIFNSGMVNPPKDETVRIRKLLEKFGTVGDANVFYWFQNRRSRTRRRQRQIQASLAGEQARSRNPSAVVPHENSFFPDVTHSWASFPLASAESFSVGSSSSTCGISQGENLEYPSIVCQQQQIEQTSSAGSVLCPLDIKNSINHYGIITVFINGVATEVPRGPIDVRAMFGHDMILFHSSGVPMAVNDFGILLESLQHGESYFLFPRHA